MQQLIALGAGRVPGTVLKLKQSMDDFLPAVQFGGDAGGRWRWGGSASRAVAEVNRPDLRAHGLRHLPPHFAAYSNAAAIVIAFWGDYVF